MAELALDTNPESLGRALDALEGVAELRLKLGDIDAWLVGGAVRDLLRGESRADLDIVVEQDAVEVASLVGLPQASAEAFGTASVELDGVRLDIARARRETYAHPGALPTVEPATLAADLARRDFTVNAMALPLFGETELIDPHGGVADLEARALRVLHPDSFRDDPTRALRAARYAARLGFQVEPGTLALLEAADLRTVSNDRVQAELRRVVAEEVAPEALTLLSGWGLAGVDAGAAARVRATRELLSDPDWADIADPREALLAAAIPPAKSARVVDELVAAIPVRPSDAVALASKADPLELLAGRAAGAAWLDVWAREWRGVALEISGTDLMAAGVPQGPAVGSGLQAALRAKLDGEIAGRGDELRVALEAAGARPSSSEG